MITNLKYSRYYIILFLNIEYVNFVWSRFDWSRVSFLLNLQWSDLHTYIFLSHLAVLLSLFSVFTYRRSHSLHWSLSYLNMSWYVLSRFNRNHTFLLSEAICRRQNNTMSLSRLEDEFWDHSLDLQIVRIKKMRLNLRSYLWYCKNLIIVNLWK